MSKQIETIQATWECIQGQSEKFEKSETYRLLNMIHVMASNSANTGDKTWSLRATCTDSDYALTEWTNGIVDIVAETYKNHLGRVERHIYTLRATRG